MEGFIHPSLHSWPDCVSSVWRMAFYGAHVSNLLTNLLDFEVNSNSVTCSCVRFESWIWLRQSDSRKNTSRLWLKPQWLVTSLRLGMTWSDYVSMWLYQALHHTRNAAHRKTKKQTETNLSMNTFIRLHLILSFCIATLTSFCQVRNSKCFTDTDTHKK